MSMQWPWLVAKQYSNVTHSSGLLWSANIHSAHRAMEEVISWIWVTTTHTSQQMLKLLWHILNPPRSFVSQARRCGVTLILIACLLYPITPLCFTHTVGCRIALWLMHPPRAPRSSELTVAEAGGNLLGYNLICFPWSIWHIPRTPTEAGELRACTSCKNTINLFCLIQDSVCVDAWFVNVSFCSNWCICLCNTQFTLLNFPPWKKQLFYCCKLMNGRWTEEWTLVIWILGSSLRWWVTLDREWLNHPKR